jgi:Uncharacterized protein conserved in bacteria (DUF2169)
MNSVQPFSRILLAESPVRLPGERRAKPLPCRVGILPWIVDRPWLAICVSSTFRFDKSSTEHPIPLEFAPPRPLLVGPTSKNEHEVIDDFVPLRLKVDFTVQGHFDNPPMPSGAISAFQQPRLVQVGLGERRLSFVIAADKPGKIPLRPPYTRTPHGREVDMSLKRCHDGSVHHFRHPPDFDLGVYQSAIEELQYDPDEVTSIRLEGLLADPEAKIEIAMPQYTPRALVTYRQSSINRGDVQLFLDTIILDWDESTVHVVWRGLVETTPDFHKDVERILIGWAPAARWYADRAHAWDDNLRELPRGRFSWAIERNDVLHDELPPQLAHEELLMARYETWGHSNAAEPELLPHEAATIAAELVEQRWPRGEVLARHGIDDYAWSIEERAWAQHLASVRDEPEGSIGAEYVRAFQRASEALVTPREAEMTAAEFVALQIRVQRGDPTKELDKAGLGIGAYGRLERRFQAKANADAAFAKELERLRTDEEIKLGDATKIVRSGDSAS